MEITFKENNRTLGMSILGYEFGAEKADNEHDLNWITVGFRFNDGKQERTCSNSCLLTWEFKAIISSLEDLLQGKVQKTDNDDVWILEPTLQYSAERLGEDCFGISINLAECEESGGCFSISEKVSGKQLTRMIAAMRLADRCFPERFGEGCN